MYNQYLNDVYVNWYIYSKEKISHLEVLVVTSPGCRVSNVWHSTSYTLFCLFPARNDTKKQIAIILGCDYFYEALAALVVVLHNLTLLSDCFCSLLNKLAVRARNAC